jgi:hypothetical protein
MLVKLFERVQFFLQRLNCYTGIPLTTSMTELLGKIMAQVLSILALSTKTMKERQISESIHSVYLFFIDYGIETLLKKLVGRTDIEDAVQRLDTLTEEEGLMTAARNLAVTHHVDDNVTTILDVVTATKDSTQCSPTFFHSSVPTHLPDPILFYDSDGCATAFVTPRRYPFLSRLKHSTGNQSREKLRTWLSPPDPSINHNVACDTRHEGTAKWFIQGETFDDWKRNGSLLWIRGNRAVCSFSWPSWCLISSPVSQRDQAKVSFGTYSTSFSRDEYLSHK